MDNHDEWLERHYHPENFEPIDDGPEFQVMDQVHDWFPKSDWLVVDAWKIMMFQRQCGKTFLWRCLCPICGSFFGSDIGSFNIHYKFWHFDRIQENAVQ